MLLSIKMLLHLIVVFIQGLYSSVSLCSALKNKLLTFYAEKGKNTIRYDWCCTQCWSFYRDFHCGYSEGLFSHGCRHKMFVTLGEHVASSYNAFLGPSF